MFSQIIKIIWNQRRSNGWIFAELLIIAAILWMITDTLYANYVTYNTPLGYDITNCWKLKLADLDSRVPGYVPEEQRTTTETDDLLTLMDQIKRDPMVDDACISYYSCPYSNGNSWTTIQPVDGDTTGLSAQSFQVRRVSKDFFNVFRMLDKRGNPITPQLSDSDQSIVISEDMEQRFYKGREGKGQYVRPSGDDETFLVSAVCQPQRITDYEKSNPCFFTVASGGALEEIVNFFGASNAELNVRMKRTISENDMNSFLESMGNRLTVNNLYIFGATSFEQMRQNKIDRFQREEKNRIILTTFMLINLFFGIIGTFWLRTMYRKGEIGLRMALGSSRNGIFNMMIKEGVALLVLTIPAIVVLLVNFAFFDQIDEALIPLSISRITIVSLISYCILLVMISVGIWFPARKAAKLPPAEALHYE